MIGKQITTIYPHHDYGASAIIIDIIKGGKEDLFVIKKNNGESWFRSLYLEYALPDNTYNVYCREYFRFTMFKPNYL